MTWAVPRAVGEVDAGLASFVPRAILTMAIGTFAIGLTEFAVVGLLPQIASDLAVSVPAAGNIVTAYAIGVVVGAPLLTAAWVRLPRRTLLLLFMTFSFISTEIWQVTSALEPVHRPSGGTAGGISRCVT